MLRRTIAAAGNPANYLGYSLPVFLLYVLYNVYILPQAGPLPPTLQTILGGLYTLLLSPFILAGLYGAIDEQQKTPGETGVGEFLPSSLRHFWRIAGANLLWLIVWVVVSTVISVVFHRSDSDAVSRYVDIVTSGIFLFWAAALVVEGGFFGSLGRSLQILARNPFALVLALAWGLFRFGDNALLAAFGSSVSLPISLAEAALAAAGRVLATVYALALYRQIRHSALETQPAAALAPAPAVPEAGPAAPSPVLLNTGLGFAFVSFLPLVHLVPLVLGILAVRRYGRFNVRSAIAIGAGGFFTAAYALLLAGLLITISAPSPEPGYGFLTQANPGLSAPVSLLEQHSYEEAQGQLQALVKGSVQPDWTVYCALALAQWENSDRKDALVSFDAASGQKPERSEFYYYYGRVLLEDGQVTAAGDQFRNASLYGTGLEQAQQYANLADSAYTPSQPYSIGISVLALLILFTVHEFGHAYVAWKLGDDTAQRQGRLTLNPIVHLDLFGSIILPAILIAQNSGLIFGWARPVPVNPANFKDPQRDHMRVSFAGPAVNLLVAMLCFLILGGTALALRVFWPDTLTWNFASPYPPLGLVGPPDTRQLMIILVFIKQLMYTSLVLGFFNLIPLPPLDGSWILRGILPTGWRSAFDGIRRFGFLPVLLLSLTPVVGSYLAIPIIAGWSGLQLLISAVRFG